MTIKNSDEQLLRRYTETGDPEFFGELYDRYIPLLYGLCLKYMHSREKAEDAVMGLFESLLPRVSGYDIRNFRTWIYSVAKNHCLQLLRSEKPIIKVEINETVMESDPVLHLLDEGGSDKALGECMERLPEGQRTAIGLFFLEEMSYADVAEKTGYSLSAVKSFIQNGKRNLRICMEKKGIFSDRV